MRIVLYDTNPRGHHLTYMTHLITDLLSRNQEVILVTARTQRFMDLYGRTEWSQRSFAVEYVGSDHRKRRVTRLLGRVDRTWFRFLELQRCLSVAGSRKADALHLLSLDSYELALWASTRGRAVPMPIYGTLWWSLFDSSGTRGRAAQVRLWIRRRALRFLIRSGALSDVFVHDPEIAEEIGRLVGGRERTFGRVVPDPIYESRNDFRRSDSREKLGFPSKATVVAFLGEVRRNKGPDIFLRMLSLLGHERNVHALLMGEPAEDVAIEDAVEGLEPKIRSRLKLRLGYLPEDELYEALYCADIVCLPYREMFSGTSGILQLAAGAGIPVVATDVGRMGPTVREYGLGVVVRPESAAAIAEGIKEILDWRDGDWGEFAGRAETYARNHRWDDTAAEIFRTYCEGSSSEKRNTGSPSYAE